MQYGDLQIEIHSELFCLMQLLLRVTVGGVQVIAVAFLLQEKTSATQYCFRHVHTKFALKYYLEATACRPKEWFANLQLCASAIHVLIIECACLVPRNEPLDKNFVENSVRSLSSRHMDYSVDYEIDQVAATTT